METSQRRGMRPGAAIPLADVATVQRDGMGPIVAVALHAAHRLSPGIAARLALDDATRLREEDPYTELWTAEADVRVVATRSRFEVDLNRACDRAVYLRPDQAWGLALWHGGGPARAELDRCYDAHARFYRALRGMLDEVVERHGRFVLLDVHSYNHRRRGPLSPAADPGANPELNVGTGGMDRPFWAPVVDTFIEAMRCRALGGRTRDVRENVRFKGGYLPRWVHATYPRTGCALALEWKKVFMDEWTGRAEPALVADVARAMARGVEAARAALAAM